jgi:hypothetical protein
MVYYLIFKSSEDLKERIETVKKLRLLGCKQIRRSFYTVKKEKLKNVGNILKFNSPIFLKKTRVLVKPSFEKDGKLKEIGSLIIVAYRIMKKNKRNMVKNFLKKAPCIRLCRGVYAFSYWHERFDKQKKLVDAWSFFRFMREIDGEAVIIFNVVVLNQVFFQNILEKAKKRIENEIVRIMKGCNDLIQNRGKEEENENNYIKAKKLRKKFFKVKSVGTFFKKWLKIDLSKSLNKPYLVLKKTNFLLEQQRMLKTNIILN